MTPLLQSRRELYFSSLLILSEFSAVDFVFKRSNNSTRMKRRSSTLIAYVLVAFLTFGVLCSALAAPGQALASVGGCSQTSDAMAMQDCDFPRYLCGFDSKTDLFSQGVRRSARPGDSLKNSSGLALETLLTGVFRELASSLGKKWKHVSPFVPGKVSVRLFNSILNL